MPKPDSRPSLIVTSYNQRATLELLLASLARQTHREFEVVIADDGSSDGTAELCRGALPFPVRFVTHEDQGYRKSLIVNQAIAAAGSDYLIFLDGDVVLERHFVEDHLRLKQPDGFVCGRRVDLGPEFTATLTRDSIARGVVDRPGLGLLKSAWAGDTQNLKRAWRVPARWMRKLMGYERPIDILGSNFSAWKADVVAVNGFNEALESYWGEDGDLFIRLRNTSKRAINGKGLCVQYHLFHKRRVPTPEHVAGYTRRLADASYKWADKGYADHRMSR